MKKTKDEMKKEVDDFLNKTEGLIMIGFHKDVESIECITLNIDSKDVIFLANSLFKHANDMCFGKAKDNTQ